VNAQQIIALAIQKEQAARDLYRRGAGSADDPGLKSLFLELAAEEQRHALTLSGLDPQHLADFRLDEEGEPALKRFAAQDEPPAGPGLQDLLAYAIRRETEARDFYRRMAEGMADAEIAGLFDRFARMEEGHRAGLVRRYGPTPQADQ
jgi:rubrerythrin